MGILLEPYSYIPQNSTEKDVTGVCPADWMLM